MEDEIASDLSVFHRIEDPQALPSSRYYRLAEMLPSYDGAVRRRFEVVLAEAERDQARHTPAGAQPQEVNLAALAATTGGGQFPGIEYRG